MAEMTVFFVIVGVALAIAWVLLPFAMFGIKPLLTELIAEQRITNRHLADMQIAAQTDKRPTPD